LCTAAAALTGEADDYDELLASIGNARFVALGDNTDGTHEFCRERARRGAPGP
jgi:erythromycin esterase-like protein